MATCARHRATCGISRGRKIADAPAFVRERLRLLSTAAKRGLQVDLPRLHLRLMWNNFLQRAIPRGLVGQSVVIHFLPAEESVRPPF